MYMYSAHRGFVEIGIVVNKKRTRSFRVIGKSVQQIREINLREWREKFTDEEIRLLKTEIR